MNAAEFDALRTTIAVPAIAALSSAGSHFVVPGPELVIWLGVSLPLFSVIFGVVGVGLGQLLAPTPAVPLGLRRSVALVVALLGIEIGIVIASGQQPLVAMGWGIGLGFSGLSVAQALGAGALSGIRKVIDAFVAVIAERVGGSKDKEDGSNA